jgi:hypothetical protein
MSYCRWSSMNWMCDVYVYEHVYDGWVTEVAALKRAFPPIPDITRIIRIFRLGGEWSQDRRCVIYPTKMREIIAGIVYGFAAFWHNRIHMASLAMIPLRPIGLPHDGQGFSDKTPNECAERLEYLRGLGYKVPQYAIDRLREEAEES